MAYMKKPNGKSYMRLITQEEIDKIKAKLKKEEEQKRWHTGTPTEEGWYLIAFFGANKRIEYASAVWCYNEWDAHCQILAWQKIEPYKETD